ncbi:MAG: 30S ribosomal protein S6 [Planctomycetota bacterium]
MVLLDNDVVRADWKKAKAIVTDTITKYEGTLHSCRRWTEKRLAYPIKRKNRATYYLAYFEMSGDKIPGFLRDFELNERVLRSLMVSVDEVSEEERKLAAEEDGTEYTVPEPPEDDALELPPEGEGDDGDADDDVLDVDVPAEAGATVDSPGS